MKQRETRVVIAVALAGGLLGPALAPCAAQPVEPAARAAAPVPDGAPASPASPGGLRAPEAAQPAAGELGKPAATPSADEAPKAAAGDSAKPAAAAKPAGDSAKPAAKPGAPLPPGASIKVERTASGAKLFRITEGMLVEGQMQRPNAFLVLQRATVDYDFEALSESFLPRILAATREKPF